MLFPNFNAIRKEGTEILRQRQQYGITRFLFFQPTFSLGTRGSYLLISRLLKRNPRTMFWRSWWPALLGSIYTFFLLKHFRNPFSFHLNSSFQCCDPWHFGTDPDPRMRTTVPYHWLTDPALFVSGFQDVSKKYDFFTKFFLHITFEGTVPKDEK